LLYLVLMATFTLPPLTALTHEEKLSDGSAVFVALCPELDVASQGSNLEEAKAMLLEAAECFLEDASTSEVEARLAKGFTPTAEPLKIGSDSRRKAFKGRFSRLMAGATVVSKTAGSAALHSGSALAHRADDARKSVGTAIVRAHHKTADVGGATAHRVYPLLVGLTERAGDAIDVVAENPTIRRLAQNFNLERWLDVSEHVDIEKAQESVANLKEEHPDETSTQIAHRLITQKALFAGGIGLSTGLMPGSALPLLAVDLAATALLQAELVYQIAAAYDLDLEDPARKGELLAIFGCVLGAGRAVKAGLAVLKNAPVAGAVIGASANAVMIYSLGRVACKFYEEKLHLQTSTKALDAVKQEGELFLSAAMTQETIADQILIHIFLAGQPNSTREELLDILNAANLSPASLEAISENLDSPLPLDDLLAQLQPDFAAYLLGQCHRIAQMDGILTDEEKETLDKIAQRFEIDLEVES